MVLNHRNHGRHSSRGFVSPRTAAATAIGWFACLAIGQTPADSPSAGKSDLRRQLTQLMLSGQIKDAVVAAQEALTANPDDVDVRKEYVELHVALARMWFGQRRFDDCETALDAIRAIEPDHSVVRELGNAIASARRRAARAEREVATLLRLELFDTAIARIEEIGELLPEARDELARSEQAAWHGSADDQYLARNFREALALYEQVLSIEDAPTTGVAQRWGISLALSLTEPDIDPANTLDETALLARIDRVLAGADTSTIRRTIQAQLADRAGRSIDAARGFSEALGETWRLPAADRRDADLARLRERTVEHLHELYEQSGTQRRDGPWRIALPDVWKQRQTAHFNIAARNDFVAKRVAEAAEYHFAAVADWLDVSPRTPWSPRCTLRVYESLATLHAATGASGATRAVTHSRTQGDDVLLREINLSQDDPWLLSGTLPHELTHVLLTDAHPRGVPPVIDEGIAVQAEPAARRLQFRRHLIAAPPAIDELLAVTQTPADVAGFYAGSDALVRLLLARAASASGDDSRPPIRRVHETFVDHDANDWWTAFGWATLDEANAAWRDWAAANADPPRVPLMILHSPPAGNGD